MGGKMNKRQKLKRIKIDSTAKQRKKNRELCEKYPFLIPRNVWTDKVIWDKDIKKYSITLADEFPRGWWKAFGLMLCEELREDLIRCNYLYKFRFNQIKEKYGHLRCYHNGIPINSNADRIIDKYSNLSENICIRCGRPDVPMTNCVGWYSPHCYHCYKDIRRRSERYWKTNNYDFTPMNEDEIFESYEESICGDRKMVDWFPIHHFTKDGNHVEIVDVSDIAKKIRNHWEGHNGQMR